MRFSMTSLGLTIVALTFPLGCSDEMDGTVRNPNPAPPIAPPAAPNTSAGAPLTGTNTESALPSGAGGAPPPPATQPAPEEPIRALPANQGDPSRAPDPSEVRPAPRDNPPADRPNRTIPVGPLDGDR